MLYESQAGDFTIALTGDTMLSRRLMVFREERFLRLQHLLHDADVAFTNFESCCVKPGEGVPTISQGTYMATSPNLLEDLKWLGFNLLSAANNHAFDWGEEGVLLTARYLDEAGLAHSGIGKNLREAVRPVYFDTPKGRVALVSANSFYHEAYRATNQGLDSPGKAGMNLLGFWKNYVVDRESFDDLRRIGAGLAFDADRKRRDFLGFADPSRATDPIEYEVFESKVILGNDFEVRTSVIEQDAAENLRQLREARRQADGVIFSHHYHEMGGRSLYTADRVTDLDEPAEFVVDFAHRCIDEGVDVFVGHGPHFCLGMEVYRDKPIFYSLGNIILQNETVQVLPSYAFGRYKLDPLSTPADFMDSRSDSGRRSMPADPLYWEAVVPVCKFSGGNLKEISIYPVDLGFQRPQAQRGRPILADGEIGGKIGSQVARLPSRYGAVIEYVDGRGVVSGF